MAMLCRSLRNENRDGTFYYQYKCADVIGWTFIKHAGELVPVMDHGQLKLSDRGVVAGLDHAVVQSRASNARVCIEHCCR